MRKKNECMNEQMNEWMNSKWTDELCNKYQKKTLLKKN